MATQRTAKQEPTRIAHNVQFRSLSGSYDSRVGWRSGYDQGRLPSLAAILDFYFLSVVSRKETEAHLAAYAENKLGATKAPGSLLGGLRPAI